MHYNDETRTAYLFPPRTAGRSVSAWLETVGFRKIGKLHDVDAELVGGASLVLCTVRHPCDVLASWWGMNEDGHDVEASSPLAVKRASFKRWLLESVVTGRAGLFDYADFLELPAPHVRLFAQWKIPTAMSVSYRHLAKDLHDWIAPADYPELPRIADAASVRTGETWEALSTPAALDVLRELFSRESRELGFGGL